MGLTELIVLSTQTVSHFQSKGGFNEGTPEDLPPACREKYNHSGRNSKSLVEEAEDAGIELIGRPHRGNIGLVRGP